MKHIKIISTVALLLSLLMSFQMSLAKEIHAKPIDKAKVTDTQSHIMQSQIDINKADAKTFATLKSIGTKKAAAIVAYRKKHGTFKSIEDLLHIKGISQAIIDKNKDKIKIG
ncbi:MAG: helix-hairpin-helix domain-containing protein [Pseudomonadota bacterium]